MTDYDPGKIYLLDLDGETHQAVYRQMVGSGDAVFLTYDGVVIDAELAQHVREPIILDPEDEDVQEFVKHYTNPALSPNAYQFTLASKIRAQITPPEPDPEPTCDDECGEG